MATTLTISDIFDLPADVPACIVKIQDFDDPETLRQNVRDYVISDTVGQEMERLVERIVHSAVRQESGTGHYLHGSFGSGKSHFMAILGLVLQNNAAVWEKEHPAVQRIHDKHGQWLAQNPVLVIPVYMLGQDSLQNAVYNAANARLAALGKSPAAFSDAGEVIENFRKDAASYGDVVYQRFEEATGIDREMFDELARGSQDERDDLARDILEYRNPSAAERKQLYPDKFSDGIAMLTRHAKELGYAAVVFMIDELILYLTQKPGREYIREFNDLVALTDNSALDRRVPVWVLVAQQRNIAETVPEDSSEQHIRETMEHHKDRFPETTQLADTELVPIIEERVLRTQPGRRKELEHLLDDLLEALPAERRDTLMHDLSQEDFRRVYPFHPALIRTLIDVSNRLSRERTSIRLLYEMLIRRHPDLPAGSLVPYASLFDVVFQPDTVYSGSRAEELDAVRETYFERLQPVIDEAYDGEPAKAERARVLVKTILLAGLSRTMRDDITVDRLIHLNHEDLSGRTPVGSQQLVAGMLADLSNRTELIHFHPNPTNPGGATVHIDTASGVQLADVLKRVTVTDWQRIERFQELMRDQLGRPTIRNEEFVDYKHDWRGNAWPATVRFANVAELTSSAVRLDEGDEFSLYIDYPFDVSEAYSRADDRKAVERFRERLPRLPIGFWLPAEFTRDDQRDLDEYAKMEEIERRQEEYLAEYGRTQRDEILTKIAGQKRTKASTLRTRLEQLYKGAGANVTFLDPAITPSLDTTDLKKALERIGDAVLERKYPHHPHFPSMLQQRTLRRLLDEFLVPAAAGSGAVERNADLDGLLQRLGEPLQLAVRGAETWRLQPRSMYLNKLFELAEGTRVRTDDIAQGLREAFGFNQDLVDTFLLYLIKGQGYRALRDDRPVADVDYGRLSGLVLERGERLAPHQWSQVKVLARNTWDLTPAMEDLTVTAQDRLWNQLSVRADNVRLQLVEIRKELTNFLNLVEVPPESSDRLAVVNAAFSLNSIAQEREVDAHEGLQKLLAWQPDGERVTREQATNQIAQVNATKEALARLEAGTVERIKTLTAQENEEAVGHLQILREVLAEPQEKKELLSNIRSWQQKANEVIDRALSASTTSASTTGDGKYTTATTTTTPAPQVRDGFEVRVQEATVEIGGEAQELDRGTVERAVGELLQGVDVSSKKRANVTLHIVVE